MSAPTRSRPLKEAIFVQVRTPDQNLVFFDETGKLGKKMPYAAPEATCAMRATAGVVAFSLLKYSKKTRTDAAEQRLELPRGPLDRTERRAETLGAELPVEEIAVEVEDAVHRLRISRDENGVASLESPIDVDDVVMELPRSRMRLTIVLHSPRGTKVVAAGFQGHVGKPGAKETLPRIAAIALNHLTGLPAFRMVSGIETVNVPASPARYQAARPVLKDADRVRRTVPVRLWQEGGGEPLGVVDLDVEIDLETANPISGRLLSHLTVPAAHAELFEPYKAVASDAVLNLMTRSLGVTELNDLVFSIALGELGAGDIERLRDALALITGLELNPKQWAEYKPAV